MVGDDAQSIYAFRAAEVRNILDFPGLFTPRAAIVALEENYRSTPEILGAANAVIAEAREGYAKRLRSDRPAGRGPGWSRCATMPGRSTSSARRSSRRARPGRS